MSPKNRFGKFVILGASGFVGKALADYYTAAGREVVRMGSRDLDLRSPDSSQKLSACLSRDTVLIIASAVTLDREKDSPDIFTANVEILQHIARALQSVPVRHCIYFSSVSVYGDEVSNLRIHEQTAVAPSTYYGAAKFAGEGLFTRLAQEAGFPLLILRPCRVYGPGLRYANYGPVKFVCDILRQGRVEIYGDGRELRDQLYIGDLVRMTDVLLLRTASGVYNLATGRTVSFRAILSALGKISPHKFRIVYKPRTRKLISQKFQIRKFLKLEPRFRFTTLAEGLKATFEWRK